MVGCETKAETGALVGAGGGAVVGGAIGSVSHSRAGAGALIGAGVGAIGGALVGNAMDQQDKKDHSRNKPITRSDIINWTQRGTSDDIIIDRIDHSGTVFYLTAADENNLHDRGVSEAVISAMRDTARR
jgi:uncharacterized protein YcfJ